MNLPTLAGMINLLERRPAVAEAAAAAAAAEAAGQEGGGEFIVAEVDWVVAKGGADANEVIATMRKELGGVRSMLV